jgi:hypothetical protein
MAVLRVRGCADHAAQHAGTALFLCPPIYLGSVENQNHLSGTRDDRNDDGIAVYRDSVIISRNFRHQPRLGHHFCHHENRVYGRIPLGPVEPFLNKTRSPLSNVPLKHATNRFWGGAFSRFQVFPTPECSGTFQGAQRVPEDL